MKRKEIAVVILIVIATLAVSSAATAFSAIPIDSGSYKAAWRLQVTSIVTFFLCAIQLKRTSQSRVVLKNHWHLILISGFCLGVHFAAWATSLLMTSMAHSMAFVSCGPILLIIVQIFRKEKPNLSEIIGVIIGFGGLLMISLGDGEQGDNSIEGDMIAFLGAVTVVIYFMIGKHILHQKNYIWCYLFPVNMQAWVWAYFAAISVQGQDPAIIVEWTYNDYWVYVVYLGIVPGILGHAFLNYCMKVISPLVISVFVNFEPLFGSIIGWVFGYQDVPGVWTWIGGFLLIIGNSLVTLAKKIHEKPKVDQELIQNNLQASVQKSEESIIVEEQTKKQEYEEFKNLENDN